LLLLNTSVQVFKAESKSQRRNAERFSPVRGYSSTMFSFTDEESAFIMLCWSLKSDGATVRFSPFVKLRSQEHSKIQNASIGANKSVLLPFFTSSRSLLLVFVYLNFAILCQNLKFLYFTINALGIHLRHRVFYLFSYNVP